MLHYSSRVVLVAGFLVLLSSLTPGVQNNWMIIVRVMQLLCICVPKYNIHSGGGGGWRDAVSAATASEGPQRTYVRAPKALRGRARRPSAGDTPCREIAAMREKKRGRSEVSESNKDTENKHLTLGKHTRLLGPAGLGGGRPIEPMDRPSRILLLLFSHAEEKGGKEISGKKTVFLRQEPAKLQ